MSGPDSSYEKIARDLTHLAGLARFILASSKKQFVDHLVTLYEEVDVAFVRLHPQYNHQQRLHILGPTIERMLELVANNASDEYVQETVHDWKNDELPISSRDQIDAQTLALISYSQGKTFRSFISEYTTDPELKNLLIDDIARFATIHHAGFVAAYIEIKNQELLELNQRLRKREQQLLEAQEVGHVGSYEWDFTKRKLEVTPFVYRILETDAPDSLEEFLRMIHVEDRRKLRETVENAVLTGHFVCEFRYTGGGTEKVVLSRGKLELTDGKPSRMIGTVMDVTERSKMFEQLKANERELIERKEYLKELNNSLKAANRELRRINDEVESFNFIASHDLQEPLRKIRVYSNRILENGASELSPALQEHFEKIMKAAGRMQNLIEDFLSFSQTATGSHAVEEVDVNAVVDEIANELAPQIKEANATIEVGDLPKLQAIHYQIKQLLMNLVGNALKYTKPDIPAVIHISASRVEGTNLDHELAQPDREYFCIEVSDNGIGFDPKYSKRIFELFQRLHNRETYSGTGIGLALCKKIAQNMGGFIDAESVPGEGSTFRVYVPVIPPDTLVPKENAIK